MRFPYQDGSKEKARTAPPSQSAEAISSEGKEREGKRKTTPQVSVVGATPPQASLRFLNMVVVVLVVSVGVLLTNKFF